ncbi:hypothetical protein GCM10027159_34000 [Lysobacter terrae]
MRGFQLGLVVVANAAFGHQPRRFMREAAATLVDPGLRVLLGVLSGVAHDDLRGWHGDGERFRRGQQVPAEQR